MNIGDKVRGIHTSDEGIVIKLINNDLVEIEIEDEVAGEMSTVQDALDYIVANQ